MTSLQSRPLQRTLEIEPNLDTDNSVIYNYPSGVVLEVQLSMMFQRRINANSFEGLSSQIKNKNMEKVYYHTNRVNRSMYQEHYAHVDQRLDWLSSSVEEEDNEEKNNETFGLHSMNPIHETPNN